VRTKDTEGTEKAKRRDAALTWAAFFLLFGGAAVGGEPPSARPVAPHYGAPRRRRGRVDSRLQSELGAAALLLD
jgi:hypothetical protein